MKCEVCGKDYDCGQCKDQCERKNTASKCICPACIELAQKEEVPELLDILPENKPKCIHNSDEKCEVEDNHGEPIVEGMCESCQCYHGLI